MNKYTYIILIFSFLVDFLLLDATRSHAHFNSMQYCTENLLCIFRVVTCFGPVDPILNVNIPKTL